MDIQALIYTRMIWEKIRWGSHHIYLYSRHIHMKKDHLDPFPVFICAENGPNGIIACEIW